MRPRSFRIPLALAVLMLTLTTPAQAQTAKINKAIEAIKAFENGDRGAIEEARAAINLAASHPKTSQESQTWVVRGHIYLQNVLDPDLGGTSADPTKEVIKAFVKAGELGLDNPDEKAAVIADLKVVQSAVQTEVFDMVERRRWQPAYELLGRAMAARDLLISMDASDDRRDAKLLRLAVLITTHNDRLDEAKKHHRAFLKAGEFDPTISVQLTTKLNENESPDTALVFIRKVRKDHMDDATLLTKEVEVLLEAERNDEVVEILDKAAETVPEGVGPQLLLAKLYERAGAQEKSEAAYRSVLDRDPEVEEALVPMARFILAEIPLLEAQISGEALEGQPKPAKLSRSERETVEKDLADKYTSVVELLEKAREKQPESREILEMLHDVYEATENEEKAAKTAKALENLDGDQE